MFNGSGGVYAMAVGLAVWVGLLAVTTAQAPPAQAATTQAPPVQAPATQAPATQAPPTSATTPGPGTIAPRPIGTMSELMIRLIYPTSDAVFYITTRAPSTEAEWGELQAKTLTLAEAANLLMLPGRARDQDRWMVDAKLMYDAGVAAFRAGKAKEVPAL